MAQLESIIRPFGILDISPPMREVSNRRYVAPVSITAGKGGSGKTINCSYHLSAKWYKDTSVREISQRN
jgi:hypothetical protein